MKVLHSQDLLHPPPDASRRRAAGVDQHGEVTGADADLAGKPVLRALQQGQTRPEGLGLEPGR